MNKFISSLVSLLMVVILASGCALLNPTQAAQMTPDQIKAYQSANMDVIVCLNVGGPPPAGNAVFMVLPKGAQLPVFGDGCHIVPQAPSLLDQLPAGSTMTLTR